MKKVFDFLTENPNATCAQIDKALGLFKGAASQVIASQTFQQRMSKIMELDPELNDKALAERMKEGLQATRMERSFDKGGNLRHEFKDADYATRRGYLELASKWGGQTAKVEHSGDLNTVKDLLLNGDEPGGTA